MNICYMAPDVAVPYFRGASTHVYEVSKNLSAKGHRVSVISRRLNRSQPRRETLDGFEILRMFQAVAFEPPGSSYSPSHVDRERLTFIQRLYSWYLGTYRAFQLGAEVATIMSGREIDVVLERETAFGAGAVLSSILGVPMVLEMIGPRVSALSLKKASRVLAYSTLMAGGRVPTEKLTIVPAGVDTDAFAPDSEAGLRVRRKHDLGSSYVVGYVGTFQRWHGVNELLSACATLRSRTARATKVLLVGPYFAEAKKLSKELGVGDDCVFTGPVPYEAVPDYVNACDVLCAPYNPAFSKMRSSRGIGAPLKVLEYMACEKPVISTTLPPIEEVVAQGTTGLLVRPGEVESLANAILELEGNPAMAAEMGKKARATVVGGYSWEVLARTLERALLEARGERGGGAESWR